MKTQDQINFDRIAKAIQFIQEHFKRQPSLEDIASHVNLSPFHFQRLFSEWAGTSPKRFLQYVSIGYAKKLLKQDQSTLFTTALETGLSGTSRLHDLFVNIEGMTPGEYKNGGENLHINYSFAASPFGNILVASTPVGICHLAFYEEENIALQKLQIQFPKAKFSQVTDLAQQNALFIFNHDWSKLNQIKLHLKGTDFQLKVWEMLLKIPMGQLSSYGIIAQQLQNHNASRAVGTAIGTNPVAFLIPCHRVIQATGALGGYHWGLNRKSAMIAWEAAKTNPQDD
ncbi:methylated-DNA--[protein]-cysteine S-methyltransferase [Pedobacter rhizosphaerae]|uniref:methylated-DNA--[protein]-cysteine S-methyltransferase n=1 Tax=Pedobacter rhizosphaerae TaxID=390241 RepID=A0A1H9QDW1_9SPHI|nr:methylated-DNA--[protein]-cysteine S-methyltransferase [Pedobacter rhizosphaerae]SER58716.1 AraC family transcriptional regulator, regulatory protein of adaptative response / methylated-DNA-[protein]-cysteine methyltransferase [Pedobacter rhizosphaerae]